MVLGGGCLGDVNGLLQRSSQVYGSLLDHLPDVLDPVLFVLYAGRLPLAERVGWGSRGQKVRSVSGSDLSLNLKNVCLSVFVRSLESPHLCFSYTSMNSDRQRLICGKH